MATTDAPKTVKASDEVTDLRDQIEVALLNRIAASVAQATPAELRDMLAIYAEVVNSDWYSRR